VPRVNRNRDLQSEDHLARRIAYERERAGWSYAGLAQRMTSVGCAIDASALYKIEKATPRRRITVAELIAFAAVFDVPSVSDLLLPPELWAKRQAAEAVEAYQQARVAWLTAAARLREVAKGDPLAEAIVNEQLTDAERLTGGIHSGGAWIGEGN
jgi:transcriptional regulator with XRE-family HTH domain